MNSAISCHGVRRRAHARGAGRLRDQAQAAAGDQADVEVGAPAKANIWKHVATPADQDRLARLGLAWQEALAEAKKTNAADVRREGKLLHAARRACRGRRRLPEAIIAG